MNPCSLSDWLQLPTHPPDREHGFMMYPLVLKRPDMPRADVIRYLERHRIETRYLLPLINQPIYRQRFGNLDAEYPVAARLNETAFYVGCHPEITGPEIDYMIACFHACFRAAR